MRGIVIWYSKVEYTAIIWCEDSRALAYAKGATAWRNPMIDYAVGDDVCFDVVMSGQDRIARDITRTVPRAAPDLPRRIVSSVLSRNTPERPKNPLLHLCASRD